MDTNVDHYKFRVGRVFPKAPLGVLGAFIDTNLQRYIEPTRAGTPKGETVGLSRKKFHAALLSLTSLDLRKQAKLIRVSYGLLRKWRTEEALLEEVRQLEKEFLNGPFIEAARFAMDTLLHPEIVMEAEEGLDLEAIKDKRNLYGFEDAELYSARLIAAIKTRFERESAEALGTPDLEQRILASLPWIRPLGRIYRTVLGDIEPFRRQLAVTLALILSHINGGSRPESEERKLVSWCISALICDALTD